MKELDIEKVKHLNDYCQTVPFSVVKEELYSAKELYSGYDPDDEETFKTCYDSLVYKHFIDNGKVASDVQESLARTLHDFGINKAMDRFFQKYDSRKCIGIMGGHAKSRTDETYRKIVFLSKKLTELGFVMISGGGPGAMEATHLGAWMAGRRKKDVEDALKMLAIAPTFRDQGWLSTAFKVMEKYPQKKYVSLGIPTWLYGHEPSTPFATHIAKFFENSKREDIILTVAYGGIIYTPGSAGTIQEVFQDAVQNHYLSFGFSSPMIFLGEQFWTVEMPVYHLMKYLVKTGKYQNLNMTVTDKDEDIINVLVKFRDTLSGMH